MAFIFFKCHAVFFFIVDFSVMMFPVVNILEKKLIPNPGEKLWQGVSTIREMEMYHLNINLFTFLVK